MNPVAAGDLMKVLLSNDDGINSPGLDAVREAVLEWAELERVNLELWIIAPDGERSGKSHSITLHDPVRARKLAERTYAISGSPADCVVTAVLGLIQEKPDIVISGINFGPNLGTDITYSGTAAVARQAAYMGMPGVAVSMGDYAQPQHTKHVARFVARHIPDFVRLADPDHFLNINAPNIDDPSPGVEITHPCRRLYNDRMVKFELLGSRDSYWFLDGVPIESLDDPGSDADAIRRGKISITPIHLHPVKNRIEDQYRELFLNQSIRR